MVYASDWNREVLTRSVPRSVQNVVVCGLVVIHNSPTTNVTSRLFTKDAVCAKLYDTVAVSEFH
jgi:hypothetical protein